jgi:hypothetical protein
MQLLFITKYSGGMDSYAVRVINISTLVTNIVPFSLRNISNTIKKMKYDSTNNWLYLYFTNELIVHKYNLSVPFSPPVLNITHSGNDPKYMDMKYY